VKKKEHLEIQDPALGMTEAAVIEIDRKPVIDKGSKGTIKSGRLAGLTMWHAIFVLSWPVLIESFLAALVGLVDTTLAAGLSEAATDAIGVASYFNWFVNLLGISLGIGATALVSRSIGRGRIAVANAALGQCLLIVLVAGFIGAVGIMVFAPAIASALQLSDEAHPIAVNYMRILALGVPASTLIAGAIACLRGAGDSVTPLLLMLVINIVNVVLSFALSGVDFSVSHVTADGELVSNVVLANPFGFSMGTQGIAIATTAAWFVGAVFAIATLIRGKHDIRLMRKRLRPHWHTMRRLIRVALPNFFESFGMWAGNIIIIVFVGWMATPGLFGSHIVAIRIEAFSFMPGFAVSLAAATLAGQYLGADRPDLARKAILRCVGISTSIMFAFSIAFIFFPNQIVGMFSSQQLHLELTPKLLVICGLVQIPFAIGMTIRGAMRGAGDTKVVMLITWFSTYAVRIPLAWLFSGVDIPIGNGNVITNPAPLQEHFDIHPLVGLWIGLSAELVIRFLLFLARFLHGGWSRIKV